MKKNKLIWLGLLTLIGFPLTGIAGLLWAGEPVEKMFPSHEPLWIQILGGAAFGWIAGKAATFVISRPFLSPVLEKYGQLIKGMGLNLPAIVFISFCAGFGEELLFRGAIQLYLGIWITAILFVAIHGYLTPFNWRISVYGIYMTLVIAALGYATEMVGIWFAATAHMVIDILLFIWLKNFPLNNNISTGEHPPKNEEYFIPLNDENKNQE